MESDSDPGERFRYEVQYSARDYHQKLDNLIDYSCQNLRRLFITRWTEVTKTLWLDGDFAQQEEHETTDIGKRLLKAVPRFQNHVYRKWCVDNWDMSLLRCLLLTLDSPNSHKQENAAIRQLMELRNLLFHSPNKKVEKEDYEKHVNSFRKSCLTLGVNSEKLNKVITDIGIASSLEAWQVAKEILHKATKCMKTGEMTSALTFCNDAMEIPSLLPENLGTVYETRAQIYLAMNATRSSIENQKQILLDLRQAIDLNDRSWTAHYLLGKLYRLQDKLKEAISQFQKALAISPSQADARKELGETKLAASIQEREDHYDPRIMPRDLDERLEIQYSETSLKMTEDQFLRFHGEYEGKLFPGQNETFQGHRYRQGWKCEPDYKKAVDWYTKADEIGNPEGSYNLACLFQEGLGVTQDIEKAVALFRKVAAMPADIPGVQTRSVHKNAGVTAAQYALGLMYDYGAGLEQNIPEAIKWYKMAMLNGVGNAANNLGIIYNQGKGGEVPDKPMAELCWKMGIELNDLNAAANLAVYYQNHLEPEKYLAVMATGREMGHNFLNRLKDEEIKTTVTDFKLTREALEPELIAFEETMTLPVKGWTFAARLKRKQCLEDARMIKLYKLCENIEQQSKVNVYTDFGGKLNADVVRSNAFREKMYTKICEDENSSQTMLTVTEALAFKDIYQFLDILTGGKCTEETQMINNLYEVCINDGFHILMAATPSHIIIKLKSCIDQHFQRKCGGDGEEDMKIRLCYATLNLNTSLFSDDELVLEILKEGVRRYPQNEHYYDLLAWTCGFKKDHKAGLEYADLGLQRFLDNTSLLYAKAACYRILLDEECDQDELQVGIDAYHKFLEKCEKDDRKRPEAYYQMGSLNMRLYMHCMKNNESDVICDATLEKVKQNYEMGLKAEEDQLECYLPYGTSDVKLALEIFLGNLGKLEQEVNVNVSSIQDVMERKPYLRSPNRQALLLQFRENLKKYGKNGQEGGESSCITVAPRLKQTVPNDKRNLKRITLVEMNPTKEKIYEDRIIELTIIEEPLVGWWTALNLLGEDENGDVVRLYIYNVKRDKEGLDKFGVGCKIAIMNPYMRLTTQITHGIRVDEPKCLVFRGRVESMCRFCGEEKAERKCSECKRPYCSRECQLKDWEIFGHKKVCKLYRRWGMTLLKQVLGSIRDYE